jgi:prepilin-type N-terminal cleavage/methylation domain-containing protein
MTKQKGFTLIELLVVIAIIGILSSIVVASLGQAKTNSSNASVKSNLATVRNQAAIYYNENNGSYGATAVTSCSAGMFAGDAKIQQALAAAAFNGSGGAACNSIPSQWAVSVPLRSGGHWCVDYAGSAKLEASALGSGITACP